MRFPVWCEWNMSQRLRRAALKVFHGCSFHEKLLNARSRKGGVDMFHVVYHSF